MKYEFHVGDYVETKVGVTGYIVEVNTTNTEDAYIKYILNDGETYGNRIGDREDETWGRWFRSMFNRIGQYDFAKPEQPKEIDKLPPRGWNTRFSDDSVVAKINELVDAVNKLRKGRT